MIAFCKVSKFVANDITLSWCST